jgi:protein involved in polysaccharide export with SLBB domain
MKFINLGNLLCGGVWAVAALLMAGCGSTDYASDPVNPQQPYVFPGQVAPAAPAYAEQGQAAPAPSPALPQAPVLYSEIAVNPNVIRPAPTPLPTLQIQSGRLSSGDLIRVTFSDVPQPPQAVELRIPDDGRITLPYNITVYAIGKTISQLQDEIRDQYVPKLFVRLTVNIKTEERFYYVGGEVRTPARQPYNADLTVLRAIDSVGGFTDFAKRSRIELRRANGEAHIINWDKARKNPKLDLKVFPNDQIIVHRRW